MQGDEADQATPRTRAHYRWLWPLTVVNTIGLALAVIGAVSPSGALSFLFPQIAGFKIGLGAALGVLSIFMIVLSGVGRAVGGIDAADRWYRFVAGITLASSIMFAVYLVGVTAVLMFLNAAFGG